MGGCFSLPGRATENPVNGLLQQPGLARRAKSMCQSICNFFMELFYSRWVDGRFGKSMLGETKRSLDQVELSNVREGGVIIPKGAVCYCPCCDRFFSTWKKLDTHILQDHRGKKYRRAFKCGHCWAGFKKLKSLERHVSIGKHSFPYPVRKITLSTYQGDQVFQVLQVPAGFQGTTVSLRDGVLSK